jgi:hypothetical protein
MTIILNAGFEILDGLKKWGQAGSSSFGWLASRLASQADLLKPEPRTRSASPGLAQGGEVQSVKVTAVKSRPCNSLVVNAVKPSRSKSKWFDHSGVPSAELILPSDTLPQLARPVNRSLDTPVQKTRVPKGLIR